MYLKIIQNLGVAWGSSYLHMNFSQASLCHENDHIKMAQNLTVQPVLAKRPA